jgi:hypothetical protein
MGAGLGASGAFRFSRDLCRQSVQRFTRPHRAGGSRGNTTGVGPRTRCGDTRTGWCDRDRCARFHRIRGRSHPFRDEPPARDAGGIPVLTAGTRGRLCCHRCRRDGRMARSSCQRCARCRTRGRRPRWLVVSKGWSRGSQRGRQPRSRERSRRPPRSRATSDGEQEGAWIRHRSPRATGMHRRASHQVASRHYGACAGAAVFAR